MRNSLVAIIYRHTLTLQARNVKDSAALTLMGTDVERIVESLRLINELWVSVLEVAAGVWLLTRQVSYASITPVVICIGMLSRSPYSCT